MNQNHVSLRRGGITFCVLLFACNIARAAAWSSTDDAAAVKSPAAVTPKHPLEKHFSANPTDGEIGRFPIFKQRLVPLTDLVGPGENADLSRFLIAIADSDQATAIRKLDDFTKSAPNSRWTPALRLHLAERFYGSGYFDKAEAIWTNTWAQYKSAKEGAKFDLAEQSLIQLFKINGSWGRKAQIKALLSEVRDRKLTGTGYSAKDRAEEQLHFLETKVVQNALCGPVALYAIKDYLAQHYEPVDLDILSDKTIETGLSAKDLGILAGRLDMNYHWVKRLPGDSTIPVPSVVHWKQGHYSALLFRQDQSYMLEDRPLRFQGPIPLDAIDSQTSGFFLVPAGELPHGWQPASESEIEKIYGRHCSHSREDKPYPCPLGGGNSCGSSCGSPPTAPGPQGQLQSMGMATYSLQNFSVALQIQDTPIGYRPPVGPPVYFTLTYNEYDPVAGGGRNWANFSSQWGFNYFAFLTGQGLTNQFNSAVLKCVLPNGGYEDYKFNSAANRFMTDDLWSHTYIEKVSSTNFVRVFQDGTRQIYSYAFTPPNITAIVMTGIEDASGNRLTLEYGDGTNALRLLRIIDAIGQTNTLSYAYSDVLNFHKITSVTDPFGRTASFQYDSQGRLTNIVDIIGMNSSVAYEAGDANDFINSLTTPYGTTRFQKTATFPYKSTPAAGRNNLTRVLLATDPLGATEALMFMDNDPEDVLLSPVDQNPPASSIPVGGVNVPFRVGNENLHFRNTLYFSKRAWQEYLKAKDLYQGLQAAHIYHWLVKDGTYEVVPILESEKRPLEGRVWYNYDGQPSGSEGVHWRGTNNLPSKVARVLDDGTTQLYQYEYNFMGKVTKSIDPIGRTFTYVYSTNELDLLEVRQTRTGNELLARFEYDHRHLVTNSVDAAWQTNRMIFSGRGQLIAKIDPLGNTWSNIYSPQGYLMVADGPLPGTNDSQTISYDPMGRPSTIRTPTGWNLSMGYDNLDRLTNIAYADGTSESFIFQRLDLAKSRDRAGREITLTHDPMRRVLSSEDPLHRVTRFEHCDCGSLSALIDPLGRKTKWEYDVQGRIAAKEYADGSRITYAYEQRMSRLKSIRDEKGQIKNYTYPPDNNLGSLSYSNAQVSTAIVQFGYDTNYNRIISMLDGVGPSTWSYYPVGVLGAGSVVTSDGPFANDTCIKYYDALGRATNQTLNGASVFTSFDSMGRMTNQSNALGTFVYHYKDHTRILNQVDYPNGQKTFLAHFDAQHDDRLQMILNLDSTSNVISRFDYAYSPEGQIVNWWQQQGSGPIQLHTLSYDPANQLLLDSITTNGITTKTYGYAYDAAGNRTLEQTDTINSSTYNALNELTGASSLSISNRTYEWDAENRLAAIAEGTHRWEFTYDGLSRRVAMTEIGNGQIIDQTRFIWSGYTLSEERDSNDVLRKQFFAQGFRTGGANHYYSKDHIGSVREISAANGVVLASYTYDPYGTPTADSGNVPEAKFTGHFYHAPTKTWLAPFRIYDPKLGRWISRDPLGEQAGLNLFSYSRNNPINDFDRLGLIGKYPAGRPQTLCDLIAYVKWLDENGSDAEKHFWGDVIAGDIADSAWPWDGPPKGNKPSRDVNDPTFGRIDPAWFIGNYFSTDETRQYVEDVYINGNRCNRFLVCGWYGRSPECEDQKGNVKGNLLGWELGLKGKQIGLDGLLNQYGCNK